MFSNLVQSGFAVSRLAGEANWSPLSEKPSESALRWDGKNDAGARAFLSWVPVIRPAFRFFAFGSLDEAPESEELGEQAARASGSAATASTWAKRD